MTNKMLLFMYCSVVIQFKGSKIAQTKRCLEKLRNILPIVKFCVFLLVRNSVPPNLSILSELDLPKVMLVLELHFGERFFDCC